MQFDNKTALITGGSSGIGLSSAIKFAQGGANVAILARDQEKLDRAVKEIERLAPGSSPLAISCVRCPKRWISSVVGWQPCVGGVFL